MAINIEEARKLVKDRALEYAYVKMLLYVLEIDIDLRRGLEKLQNAPFLQRHSIRVERSREEEQDRLVAIDEELEDAIRLLAQAIKQNNERTNRH